MQSFVMALVILIMAAPAGAQDEPSDLSGTWLLQADADTARSRRPITGLSIATELVIRQSPAAVTLDTNTGTGNTIVTTTYALDGGQHPIPGPIGWDTSARSAWDGSTLVVSIRRSVQGPDGELVFDIRETYSREADTLTLERSQGRTVQTLVYQRK